MEKQITFQMLKSFSKSIEKNELFTHYSLLDFPFYYDINFMQLHFNPTVEEFQLLEKLLRDYQGSHDQQHIKFLWPENTGLFIETFDYLNKENFELGKLELLQVNPTNFKQTRSNHAVSVQQVTSEMLETFIALNYEADLLFGKEFALNKQAFYRFQFQHSDSTFWLAFIEEEPVGSLVVIHSETFLEIDNVYTAEAFRKQGVASELLAQVVKDAQTDQKTVVLLADAEDSPLKMYQKQGFESVASQIHVLKEF